ncbi:ABC transporter ATP-binding protein [Lacticaseibacillus nasuensis]|uniref:ABC transporter ATP-binding protein n=1 Tax=Lacticaseibacillus nasuensis TaxID=944671 RepID=UPI002247E207|nr:ABC transporter ATP-binding protein [Lacticaseibacillus nasuensis]MCX2454566.1 ABC transporter ATP-binding protein [Lacticaseibacillus nasuensis]
MSNLIEFDHVTKEYHDTPVVADLTLNIEEGELFVLVGPSGGGKTTTLKMINRLVTPNAGVIRMRGKAVTDYSLRELRWDIGYVLQQIALFPTMTVGQNIALIPEMKHWPKAQVKAAVDDLLTAVKLPPAEYRDRLPKQLSGGEQQRVGIIRALASKPPVVLMDEPFSALDPLVRTQLQDLVLELHAQLNTTIVFVTHDMTEALRLGDRIGVMHHAKLVQIGTPQEIAESPASSFVDDFFAGARRDLLDTPVGELAEFGEPCDDGVSLAADLPLSQVIAQLTEADTVIVRGEAGPFTLSRQAVMRFLAARTSTN